MTTSLTHFPVANPSNHGAGGSGLLDPGTGAAANSNFALVDANATASDDDVLAPSAASPSMTTQFVAVAPPPGEVTPPVAAGAIGIPGQDGDPQLEVTTSGSGLIFYDTFTSDDTLAYENCVIAAEKQYEGIITNNVTLRMTFDMGNKGDTDYNQFLSPGYRCNYATLKAALHKVAPNDVLRAVDPSNGGLFNLAPAYARMLGLTTSAPSDDAIVTFHSNGATWDFGQDVVNAVTHGISEAGLGRVSGMGVSISDEGVVTPEPDGWEPMDLFRYTASGVYDSSDGKGNPSAGIAANTTDFFSSDGGAQTSQGAGLSFTNLFNGTAVNTAAETDADDWRQDDDVFGGNNAGESNTLTATDLDVMSALGWTISLKQQVFTASSGNWETFSNWANGYNPIAAEDVALGAFTGVAVALGDDVTVNSISLNAQSSLLIDNGAVLIATDGTTVNPVSATAVLYSGNEGTITVEAASILSVGDFFDNTGSVTVESGSGFADSGAIDNYGSIAVGVGAWTQVVGAVANWGTISLGDQITGDSGLGMLYLNGPTTLSGGGSIDLGQILIGTVSTTGVNADVAVGGPVTHPDPILVAYESSGEIYDGGSLVNVDNTISGAGLIQVGSLDNRAAASIGASLGGYALQIESATILNEGLLFADAQTTLELGPVYGSASLDNTGRIDLAAGADLEISGNLTDSGAGSIQFNGAGGRIISDGDAARVLFNTSTIESLADDAEIGDVGFYASGTNDLSLVNSGGGAIIADGADDSLTINTGVNVIQDPAGILEAEDGAQLAINSAVETGNPGIRPGGGAIKAAIIGPTGGTIEATSNGVVAIAASVSEGAGNSIPGQIVIDGGTVEFLSGSSDSIPIDFAGAGGVLEVHSAATLLGAIQGVVGGDAFSVTGTSLTSVTIGASSLDIDTNSGSFDFANALYGGAITGYVAFVDPFTAGMERILLTDGNVAVLEETDKTIYEDASGANIIGEGDTIDFQGSAASTASIFDTSGEADKVNGSGGVINLYDAQAQVVGVSDMIDFAGTTGNAVSLFATGSRFDTVSGVDGIVYLDGAEAHVLGGADTVHFESGFTGNQVVLQGAQGVWDTVEGSGGIASLDATWAKLAGGGDTVDFLGASGNEANLYDTASVADTINGSNGTVFLNSSQASIVGGGDTVDFSSGSGNVATLSGTGLTGDVVEGAAGTVDLHGATAKATNNGDTFAFAGANTLDLVGTAETMAFSQGIGGLDAIAGVGATDIFQFSSVDFANFAALLAHTTQSGANTVIALNASDKVTLDGVSMSSLSSTQFKFV